MRRLLFRRADLRREVDDELAFHLEMRVRDHEAEGLATPAARAAAEREFGDVRAIRAACLTIDERRRRRARRSEYMSDLWQDLRLAARALRASPVFALTAAACVALGVGVTTTIFSMVNAVILRPLPYRDADRLVAVYAQNVQRGYHGTNISYPDYLSWRDDSRSLQSLGIWTWTSHALSGPGGDAERVEGAAVAANLFPLLGVAPQLGRGFLPEEEQAGRSRVVLLSDGLWRRRYDGDRSIVGKSITVDAQPYTVVGVMPPGFAFPDRGTMWVPFVQEGWMQGRGNRGIAGAIGRLKPGVSLEQARADLATVSARLEHEYRDDNTGWAAELTPLREDLVGELRKPVLVFLGAAAGVLLIACANVANLTLARGAARQRELAVRAAIGAGRGRLARQILTECVVVAALGGAVGAVLSVAGVALLARATPDGVPFYVQFSVDRVVLAFAVLLSLATGLAFGLGPAVRTSRVSLSEPLREGTRATGDSAARGRARGALVVTEVALSLVLMIGAGLLVRSYRALLRTDLGFTESGVLTARVSLPEATYKEASRRQAFYDALLERVAALPGVRSVGSGQGIPFSGWDVQAGVTVEGRGPARPNEDVDALYQYVTPGFLDAMGVPIVRGRGLRAADRDTAAMVGVVNELFAKTFFPNVDPLGRRVRTGPQEPWVTIVGVARDYRHFRLPRPAGPALYLPYATYPMNTQTLVVRTSLADPLALAPAVRAAVRALDPTVPVYRVQSMEEQVARSVWRQRLQGQVLAVFAALALLLAVVGMYGVISYAVAQRTRELGVRLALGASRAQVLGLVLRQGTRLALVGVAIGLGAAFLLSRVVASLLYEVTARDPLTFGLVPLLLAAAAVLASLAPARRATRVDPLIAMRAD
ncbi:permease (plasmid) [Gemmatirosa kalamazoonensis]|uniref:Permease n=1 Tax=Gemmatirosa kalamazoonensis TaxID=861299 RepID=W0RSD0_9BACT|nr:ABC transporter permease [Gemmatirosa kalamazoonensis]AHG93894.1 permease [Gemmatirosa kalamazoonensis]